MTTLIDGGIIVNEGIERCGFIVIEDDTISDIVTDKEAPLGNYDKVIDAKGCFVIPGVIDEHVHFRDPGLTEKADLTTESRAAAYGGVTSFFEMPNTIPQTTTIQALEDKFALAKTKSHVNYSFFFGATNDNISFFSQLDSHRIPGVKLFMGSSTGNMLVDKGEALENIFRTSTLPIMTHCEVSDEISKNMSLYKAKYGEDPAVIYHPYIRSEEACYQSTALAVSLSKKYGTRLHVAHLTTARELEFFGKDEHITAEAVIPHLYFTEEDYTHLGSLIKCNPAIKTAKDREELRKALNDGRITTIGTDHAPHLLKDKEGGASKATSGMPVVQFSLPAMLQLSDEGVLTRTRLVELMCHAPARLFEVNRRGFLRKGYKADITIVKREENAWEVTKDIIQSKCGWSPMEGMKFNWHVVHTFCNGHHLLNDKTFDSSYRGEEISFRNN